MFQDALLFPLNRCDKDVIYAAAALSLLFFHEAFVSFPAFASSLFLFLRLETYNGRDIQDDEGDDERDIKSLLGRSDVFSAGAPVAEIRFFGF